MIPIPQDVLAFVGRPVDDPAGTALAQEHLPVVTAMVKAYTHGRGWDENDEPADELAYVIISSTARSVSNPEHVELDVTGPFTRRAARFTGWTLAELAILHRYRRRAA